LCTLPLVHDKRIVHRYADNLINALRLELRDELVVARHVRRRAGRRKGARQREYDDVLASKNVFTAYVYPFVIAASMKRHGGNFLAFEILEHCFTPDGSE